MLFQERKKCLYTLILLTLFVSNFTLSAQNITVEQDTKFEQLLNEKRKVNASIAMNDRWKIQTEGCDLSSRFSTIACQRHGVVAVDH